MKVGIWIYGLATIITGILDIVWGHFEVSHQPIQALGNHAAAEHVLAYIAGAWLVAAGVAIIGRSSALIGAALAAAIYFIFSLLWIFRLFAIAHAFGFRMGVIVFGLGGIAAEMLLIAPAAFIYAATAAHDPVWQKRASIAGRWMLGLPPILFALGHLINRSAYVRFFPHWIPFASFWIVLTGIAFLLAGSAIISGIQDVLASRLLALMLFVFEPTVEIPPVFSQPHSQGAWGGAIYNVTAIAVCLIFAEFVNTCRQANRKTVDVSGHIFASHQDSLIA